MSREAGWYSDPYFLKRERYWDGRAWADECRLTEEARDSRGGAGGSTTAATSPAASTRTSKAASTDGTPARATATASGTAGGKPDLAKTAPSHPDDTGVVHVAPERMGETARIPVTACDGDIARDSSDSSLSSRDTITAEVPITSLETATIPVVPNDGSPKRRVSGTFTRTTPEGSPPTFDGWPRETIGASPADGTQTETRQRRRRLAGLAAAIGLVSIVVVIYLLAGGGGKTPRSGTNHGQSLSARLTGSAAAREALAAAALDSTQRKSVVISFDQLIGAGQHEPRQRLAGTGGFFLGPNIGVLTLRLRGSTPSQAQQIVFDGPTVYVKLTSLGTAVPGKTWVSTTTASVPSGLNSTMRAFVALIGNPAIMMQQLHSGDVTVALQGASTFHGTSLQRYAVIFPSSSSTKGPGSGTYTGAYAYVTSDHLLQRIVIPTKITVDGQRFKERFVLTFSQYGKPLFVATPPQVQVVTQAQYKPPQPGRA